MKFVAKLLQALTLGGLLLLLAQCADDPADEVAAAQLDGGGGEPEDDDTAAAELADSLGLAPAEEVEEVFSGPVTADSGTRLYVFSEDSKVGFVGSKPTAIHEGGFKNFSGYFTVTGLDIDMSGTHRISIDLASVYTDDEKLTEHLKGEDFFDVAQFPAATFTLLKLTPRPEKMADLYDVNGVLELHGVPKKITFPANIFVSTDGMAVMMQARFSIDRKAFGIVYPGMADDLIRDRVVIDLDLNAYPGDPEPLNITSAEKEETVQPVVLSAESIAAESGSTPTATFSAGGGGGGFPGGGGGGGRRGGGRGGGDPKEIIASMDGNKDGKLSQDEVPEFVWGRMSAADTDGDGAISEAELTESRAKRDAERAAGGGGGDRGGGGGGKGGGGGGKSGGDSDS